MTVRAKAIVGAVLLSTCLAAFAPGASKADTPKIRIVFPGPATTLSLPYFVARKLGWLSGIDIEEINVTGDANAMRSLLSGNADIATVGTLNVLASIEAKAKVRAIHAWQPIGDYSLVLGSGKGNTLADLAGKTFAASGPGGLPDQLPRLIMRTHGIDEHTTRFVQVGGHAARLQAVIGGRADATVVNTVTALKGVRDGKVTIITRLSQEFPGLGYVWNVVRLDSLDDPRLAPAYQMLTDAGIRGSRYVMEHPDEAAEILHERLPELDLAFLKAVVHDLDGENLWGVDGGIDPKVEQDTAGLNMTLGNLPRAIPAADVLDQRFVAVALKALGTYKK
jgi:NitT/TauT family transport system substrate-binding protein